MAGPSWHAESAPLKVLVQVVMIAWFFLEILAEGDGDGVALVDGGESSRLAVDLDFQGAALLGRIEGDETKMSLTMKGRGSSTSRRSWPEAPVLMDRLAVDPQPGEGGVIRVTACPLKSTVMLTSVDQASGDHGQGCLSDLGRWKSSPLAKVVAGTARRPLTTTSARLPIMLHIIDGEGKWPPPRSLTP